VALAQAAQPRVVVPMHCADPRVDLQLQAVADFVAAWRGPLRHLPRLDGEALARCGAGEAVILAAP
jgi:L-ascorbate metabolism protein UlaG (beta-lactamase superfamily)